MPYPDLPDLSPFGERLQERTQPLAPDDDQYGNAHAYLCEALSRAFLQLQEVFDPADDVPPVAPLLNVDLCPDWALPWLAQMTGVTLPVGLTPAQQRNAIRNVQGFRRGTRQAMIDAVSVLLTGARTLYFRERLAGDAYALEVVTITSQTPDSAAVQRALLALKPGGIVLTYRVITGWDYTQMTSDGGTYTAQKAAYTSYVNLRDNVKG